MPKVGSTDDPRPPKVTPRLLEDLKTILRNHPKGDQKPNLSLDNVSVKAELRTAGHDQVTGGHIEEALKILEQGRLIRFRRGPIGFWEIEWISAAI